MVPKARNVGSINNGMVIDLGEIEELVCAPSTTLTWTHRHYMFEDTCDMIGNYCGLGKLNKSTYLTIITEIGKAGTIAGMEHTLLWPINKIV